ncbi:WD40 repeat-like protein [Xylariaceae sp. FL0255]|nr:WD40 repeat-like protein [Xylariaceae sp. FL0255]
MHPAPSPAARDRFVAFHKLSADRYRTNKPPHELSPEERLLRIDTASVDAFCLTPRRSVPISPHRASRSDCGDQRHGTVIGLDSSDRKVSHGAVWSVGGTVPSGVAVDGGRGRLVSSGSNARLYTTSFSNIRPRSEEDQEKHERRLALALKFDRAQRVLDFGGGSSTFPRCSRKARSSLELTKTTWTGTEWISDPPLTPRPPREEHILPNAPFKVLDAPGLRDDFYCSTMAFSKTCNTLAVGLGNLLYAWSEESGVNLLNSGPKDDGWLTSVAFSSEKGGKSILAFGRSNGSLSLISLFDSMLPRFESRSLAAPVACLAWRPNVTQRPSLSIHNPGVNVDTEDLLEVARDNWKGAMTELFRVKVHSQQICGLAWSPTGSHFATGGNDNLCCLFEVNQLLKDDESDEVTETEASAASSWTECMPPTPTSLPTSPRSPMLMPRVPSPGPRVRCLPTGSEKHRWRHAAAVKAIAFCPWREGLIATGGGSNDKCIHFYHTTSGTALATISVAAQVTSLIWSNTRREIAATFGYAQPDHPYRIAVFSWPDCRQERRRSRTAEEGCIVVASSDESVKFHEVWLAGRKATALGSGVLAGSDILEMEEGIDKEGEVIR